MTDDDLTRDLEDWAAATDPSADPITADEVTSADAVALPHRRRRLGLAAAVVLAVVALGVVAAVLVDDDGDGEVVTDDGGAGGPRTQIVVDGDGLDGLWWQTVHRIVLRGPCADDACAAPTVVARPLEAGTSLAVDQALAPGRWTLELETYRCGHENDDCGPPTADGTPSDDVEPSACAMPMDVGPEPARFVVHVSPRGDGELACSGPLSSFETDPELTVPPAWTLRPELPWSCGTAAYDINADGATDDPQAALTALQCFGDAIADGTPVEIPAYEQGPTDGAVRGRWRVLPEPVDGHPVEILRTEDGRWSRQRCDDIEVEAADVDALDEDGGITGYQHVGARPVGCGEEQQLSLDLPPLNGPDPDPPSATATTTIAPPSPGTIDVVLDVDDLPMFTEGGVRRWVVLVDGEEVAAGPLTEGGTLIDEVDGPEVQMIADDLAVPEGDEVAVRVDGYDCYAHLAGNCRPDAMGPAPGAVPTDGCTSTAPPEPAGSVVVVTLAGESCTAGWSEGIPSLTVPPSFSLRPVGEECATLDVDARWGQCLADAYMGYRVAEHTVRDGDLRTTYLVRDGGVTVFRRAEEPDGGVSWTTQTCASVEVDAEGRMLTPFNCDGEEPLPLDPV